LCSHLKDRAEIQDFEHPASFWIGLCREAGWQPPRNINGCIDGDTFSELWMEQGLQVASEYQPPDPPIPKLCDCCKKECTSGKRSPLQESRAHSDTVMQ